MILRRIFYALTPPVRRLVRRLWFYPADIFQRITAQRPTLVPPKGLIYTGAGDFIDIGNKFFSYLLRFSDIRPDDTILDIGCGMGRLARPLSGYLGAQGSYEGFDIVSTGVNWCKSHYRAFPNFHFRHVAIRNDLYNLRTNNLSATFTFPYAGQHFDCIFAISVFTHMQESGVRNYLREISRVLRNGRTCLCTFFVMTNEREPLLEKNGNSFFRFRHQNYFLHDAKVKDANVAYRYETLNEMAAAAGLEIKEFFPGWWDGEKSDRNLDFQDVLVLTHVADAS